MIVKDTNGYLIGIIVQVNKTIVEEKATVALLAIAIVNLLSSLDIVQGINHKPTSIISVVPCSLPGTFVVKHVCVGYEAIGLDTLNLDAKYTTRYHHTDFRVFT